MCIEHQEVMKSIVEDDITLYTDEIAVKLEDAVGRKYHESTIATTLRKDLKLNLVRRLSF